MQLLSLLGTVNFCSSQLPMPVQGVLEETTQKFCNGKATRRKFLIGTPSYHSTAPPSKRSC